MAGLSWAELRERADALLPMTARVRANPDPWGCCALVKLGAIWNRISPSLRPLCSFRARDGLFCGAHAHLNELLDPELREEMIDDRDRERAFLERGLLLGPKEGR